MRQLKLFIASSVDGYIAGPGDDLSFLRQVEREGEDYGYADFVRGVDTVILGRKTYDYVVREIGPEHYDNGERDIYVISGEERSSRGRVRFFKGSPASLLRQLRESEGKDIYCDGGAAIIHQFLEASLIDEMTISIVPTLLGAGTRLFREGYPPQNLHLQQCRTFESGLVQLRYGRG